MICEYRDKCEMYNFNFEGRVGLTPSLNGRQSGALTTAFKAAYCSGDQECPVQDLMKRLGKLEESVSKAISIVSELDPKIRGSAYNGSTRFR